MSHAHTDERQQANINSGHADADSTDEASLSAAASSAASSSALPVLAALSLAQRLYHDALISVFGFLDLRGMISAHALCRSWRDAAYKEPSRDMTLVCDPARLAWFCTSSLRHHVGEYDQKRRPCTLEHVACLRAFPCLIHVTIRPDLPSFAPLAALQRQAEYAEAITATVAQWPSRLSYLRVELSRNDNDKRGAQVQALIDCVGRLGTLSELGLILPEPFDECLSLRPLLQLTQLQTLNLQCLLDGPNCCDLSGLPSLTYLILSLDMSLEVLRAMFTPPHQLASLQRITLKGLASAACVEALTRLPALSALNIAAEEPAAFACFPRFPQLHSLTLWIGAVAISALMPHLTQCAQLTALTLGPHLDRTRYGRFTLAELTELSRALPALASLTFQGIRFDGLDRPDSLACLRFLPQLRELEFDHCSGMRLAHLTDPAFTSLPSLRCLCLFLRTPATDYPETCALFTVPCALMPQLTCTCIESHDDQSVVLSCCAD